MSRTVPVDVTVLKDWRGHKKGDVVTVKDYADLQAVESMPGIFSFDGVAPTAPSEPIVETVVAEDKLTEEEPPKPKRRRKKVVETPEEETS